TVVLDEPVAGRPIIDAWEPPPPPPPILRSLRVDATFEDIAGGRTLHLDSIDLYPHGMAVNYRLQPGQRNRMEMVQLLCDLEVQDDIGTDYDVPSGGYGGDDQQIHGDRDVRPTAPQGATLLVLIVYDVTEAFDRTERGRTTVAL